MLSSKQRATLRALANEIQPIFQIGKGGISINLADELNAALTARELIKITVLESSGLEPRAACDEIVRLTGAQPVQCIGRKIVIYRESQENPRISLNI